MLRVFFLLSTFRAMSESYLMIKHWGSFIALEELRKLLIPANESAFNFCFCCWTNRKSEILPQSQRSWNGKVSSYSIKTRNFRFRFTSSLQSNTIKKHRVMRNAVCRELGTLRKVWIVTENYQNEWQQILWLFNENSHFLITKSLTEKIIYKSLKRKADIKLGSVVSDWQITKIVSHMSFFSCMVSRKNGLVSTWTQLSSFLWLLFALLSCHLHILSALKKERESKRKKRRSCFWWQAWELFIASTFFLDISHLQELGKFWQSFCEAFLRY